MDRSLGPLMPWATFALLFGGLVTSRDARADSSLAMAAAAVVHDLGAPPHHALVIASPLVSEVPAPRGDELATRLAALVAGALGGEARAFDRPLPLAEARAKSRVRGAPGKIDAIVYLDVKVNTGELRITADLYPVAQNGWDRLRLTSPPPMAHAYFRAKVTAEVRSFLAPLHLDRLTLTKFARTGPPLLAMACGDLDGDGGNDLVLVTEQGVEWGYLAAGKFISVQRAAASAISRRAPVPWRDPLATALVLPGDGTGMLYVGWSDWLGVSVGADLQPKTHFQGFPIASASEASGLACARPSPEHSAFEGNRGLSECGGGLAFPTRGGAPAATAMGSREDLVDAWASVALVDAQGRPSVFEAAHEPPSTLHLAANRATPWAPALALPDMGAQIALVDLDQDGVPEVATTKDGDPRDDVLVLSAWERTGLVPKHTWPAPGGVTALAVCPAERSEAPSLLAAVGSEIWLVH